MNVPCGCTLPKDSPEPCEHGYANSPEGRAKQITLTREAQAALVHQHRLLAG